MTTNIEDLAVALEERRANLKRVLAGRDAEFFLREVLGLHENQYYSKQLDLLNAMLKHRRVSVCGANGSGKDWSAGQAVLLWMYANAEFDPIVITSGPTLRQVKDIVFSEARTSYQRSATPLGGRFLPSAPRWNMNTQFDDRSYAMGYSVENPLNLQGIHSPKLLVIITEAHNVPQAEIDALDRLNPDTVLMTGNALSSGGEFYESFHERAHLWDTIHISAFDTPNVQEKRIVIPGLVTWETVEDRRERYGEDSAQYIASVLGQFPANLDDTIVDRATLDKCVQNDFPPLDTDRKILSVDVGYMGEDATVVYSKQGFRCRQEWEAHQRDTEFVAGHVGQMAERDSTVDEIIIDATGIGAGVYDKLHHNPPQNESGVVTVWPFKGGERAVNNRDYFNAISEAYLEFAKAAREGVVDLDNNPHVIAQLSSRRKEIQGDRRERIEAKEKYKQRAGRSPDHADALVQLFSPIRTARRWGPLE